MLDRLYGWYGKRVVRGVLGVIGVLIVVGGFIAKNSDTPSVAEEIQKPQVVVGNVSSFQNVSSFSVVGTVRAISEANLETEAGGRVTSVSVAIGDRVTAGTILASIENSQERAQLLQAEGAYESAFASSLQSGTSLEEARVGVRNAYRDTFSTVDSNVRTVIDQFYTKTPGLRRYSFRMTGVGKTSSEFVDDRMAIEPMLIAWSERITDTSERIDEETMLADAETTISLLSNLTIALMSSVDERKNDDRFTDAERAEYLVELNGTRAELDGALAEISRARNVYEQAKISGADGTISQSSAQLKSALGTLRNAQANYEKTLVRTPITGVVNAFYLRAGEYTNLGQPAALVANNGSLEISTALGEEDIKTVTIGDTVSLNNMATGTITKIAPAVDPLTGKAEVKISVDDALTLKNGSTVTVTFTRKGEESVGGMIRIPLASLKLLPSGPVVFGVTTEGKLTAHPVTLGAILGEFVEIETGVTAEDEIVRDARGLKEGDSVTVIRN